MSPYQADIYENTFLPLQRVACALSKARSQLTADMDAALSGTHITSSQVGPLLLLSSGMANSSMRLARLLGIDPGFVTRMVDRLEKQGLVRRGHNTLDRRMVNLTLTEAGRHLAARVMELVPAVLNRRLSSFTPQEFAALCRLLGKLLDE